MKTRHCFIGFLSWKIPKLKAIKTRNHLVIPSESLCGYITPYFALWEIHPCLFSTVQNQTPQSQHRLSTQEHVYVWFVSCSFTQLRKACVTNSGCSSFSTQMIWIPIRCRWCCIIASGILDGSLQITVTLKLCRTSPIQLCAHYKALGFYDCTHCKDSWVKISQQNLFPYWWQKNRVSQLSVRANRDGQRRLFVPWEQAGGTPPCFVY